MAAVRAHGNRQESTRLPAIANSAGMRVTAARIAVITATAENIPIERTNGRRVTASEHSARMTVTPAKTTAAPDVATDRAIDSGIPMPSASCSRCRARMNIE